jgi:hypothetical protein
MAVPAQRDLETILLTVRQILQADVHGELLRAALNM